MVALVLPTLITWIYFILLNGAPAALQQTAYTLGKIVQFSLPAIWVFLIQRERQKLNRPAAWSLIAGSLFGLTVAAAMAAIYFCILKPSGLLTGPIAVVRTKIQSFGASSPPIYLLLAVFYSAIHSLLEEYYWRWFVFGQLSRVCRLPTAIVSSSVGFAAHHVLVLQLYFGWHSPLTWLFTLAIVIGGAFWAWLYRSSNSLAAPWLSHALIDAAIFAIGYTMLAA
ncbi:MAG TPA: type II CAAX endopeptidase family protein [Pirellulaceae bacterium]